MARPREFDEEHVLEQAANVFWDKGFEATVTAELERATGLKRGSIYNAFGDKRGLYLATLDYYCRVEMGEAIAAMNREKSFGVGVRALLERAISARTDANPRRGCLLCDAAIERAPHDIGIAERVRAGLDLLRRALREKLAQSGLGDQEIERVADHVAATYMGLKVFVRAGYPAGVLRRIAVEAASGGARIDAGEV